MNRSVQPFMSDAWLKRARREFNRAKLPAPACGRLTFAVVARDLPGEPSICLRLDDGPPRWLARTPKKIAFLAEMSTPALSTLLLDGDWDAFMAYVGGGGVIVWGNADASQCLVGWRFFAERPEVADRVRFFTEALSSSAAGR